MSKLQSEKNRDTYRDSVIDCYVGVAESLDLLMTALDDIDLTA